MKAIILAAALKTDYFQFHRNIPQALLNLEGRPLLDHLVGKLNRFPVINEIIVVSDQKFFPNFREWQKHSVYKKPLRVIFKSRLRKLLGTFCENGSIYYILETESPICVTLARCHLLCDKDQRNSSTFDG
jgi:NDP-sugar pyrophosphorylase family protein